VFPAFSSRPIRNKVCFEKLAIANIPSEDDLAEFDPCGKVFVKQNRAKACIDAGDAVALGLAGVLQRDAAIPTGQPCWPNYGAVRVVQSAL